ncbi:MAG: hypothetical protein ACN6I4_00065 [bacterium]
MKKLSTLILSFILVFSFTGCLDIYEEVHFNKDGSGKATYHYKVDGSGLNGLFGSEGILGGLGEKDSLALSELSRNGISDIKVIQDGSGFGISFKFEDIEALNQGLARIIGTDKKGGLMDNAMRQIGGSKTKIERVPGFLGNDSLKNMLDKQGESLGMGSLSNMLTNSITYHQVYTFDRKIKSVSNDKAIISDNRRKMTLNIPFIEMLSGESTVENTIKLKKGCLWW